MSYHERVRVAMRESPPGPSKYGRHIIVQVFVGRGGEGHRGYAGTITMLRDEWRELISRIRSGETIAIEEAAP